MIARSKGPPMHAYKIRRDEDYLPLMRAAAPRVVAASADAGLAPIASPARAMQEALADALAAPVEALPAGLSLRARVAIIATLSVALWAMIGAGVWAAL